MKPTFCRTLLAFLASAAAACAPGTKPPADPPRLVVVIVVDQMCQHHVTRFRDLYLGGFKRLLDEGAVFDNTWHDHAKTHTSPGHASISTGAFPANHGIVANQWYDRTNGFADTYSARDSSTRLIGEPDVAGASPRELLVETVGDRLKTAQPTSKVFSVALKDYAAILMGGHHPDAAYWYNDENGRFCSSTYYANAHPAWVDSFNAERPADEYYDREWTRSMPAEIYARSRADAFHAEADGQHTSFPYLISRAAEETGSHYYDYLQNTPFADELTLRFAAGIVKNEHLGADDVPDLLFVGCSAADFIGHEWGPFSQEAEDYYLRLDEYLASFLNMLDGRVGAGRYTVVLTSDHGVVPIPESREGASRISRERYDRDVDRALAELAGELGITGTVVAHRDRGLAFDEAVAGVAVSELRRRMAEKLLRLPYVEAVYTYDDLAGGDADGREYFELCRNSFRTDRGPDLYVVFRKYDLMTGMSHGTSHGSPHEYDRRVPLFFWGRGIAAGAYPERARSVDVAPTVARLLGISLEEADGRALETALTARGRGKTE